MYLMNTERLLLLENELNEALKKIDKFYFLGRHLYNQEIKEKSFLLQKIIDLQKQIEREI